MIYEYEISGLKLQTGDLICATDGDDADLNGQFWRLLGKLMLGDVEHIVVYVGPGGRCVEAGAKGMVIALDMIGSTWDSRKITEQGGGCSLMRSMGSLIPSRGRDSMKLNPRA